MICCYSTWLLRGPKRWQCMGDCDVSGVTTLNGMDRTNPKDIKPENFMPLGFEGGMMDDDHG